MAACDSLNSHQFPPEYNTIDINYIQLLYMVVIVMTIIVIVLIIRELAVSSDSLQARLTCQIAS